MHTHLRPRHCALLCRPLLCRPKLALVPLSGLGHNSLGKLGLGGGVLDREARLGSYQTKSAINAVRTEVVTLQNTMKHHACGHAPATKRLAHSSSTRAASRRGDRWKGGG